ncbi:inosine 5'-monophosphate dehydrogenase [Paraliobacillus sp. PM-2]|uniref:CBS domain-containing protein n=1 Tax=Paraliobacillus sp. PM-2 TaxID=1462524 RepID=UPI00061CDA48|nr:CBS domain-containing protein [Paraliobacillus sp. PM-2]CQR46715.1 inosine 5'-monophosphate dehydrogenase [Paraliobacillus sp. PM-2]
MFVRSTMKSIYQCHVATPSQSLKKTLAKLNEKDIQAMPVVDEAGKFLGMISAQTIYKSTFLTGQQQEDFLSNTEVSEIMTHADLFILNNEVFEKTLTTFKDYPILAVVDDNKKFLGIVTRYDVLEQFESVFGMNKSGVRIAFTSEESSGRFAKLADILQHLHANIISITTFDETDKLARRIVLKVDEDVRTDKLKNKLEKAGFRVLDITNA